ncbi:MAG: glycosyltransferase family 2 protein [Muribaculaceae bacterium]|nr:glycosyltransferase family 2 protein [Muribaculaceae bacterium]
MNHTKEYKLTIIVPIYNEEDNMSEIESRLSDYLTKASVRTCVLMVNDGSTDRSLQMIKEIAQRNDSFFYLSFRKNCGLSAAIKAGIDYADSELIGYIDADLQTDPEDFNLLLEYADDYEMVTGIRADRKDSGFKKLQSKIANNFRRMMTKDEAVDTGCPLKILRTDVAKKIPFFTGMHRFLAALVGLQNGRIKQIAVRHYPRKAGVSKFHLSNRLVAPFIDCFAFRWMRKRWYNYEIQEEKS